MMNINAPRPPHPDSHVFFTAVPWGKEHGLHYKWTHHFLRHGRLLFLSFLFMMMMMMCVSVCVCTCHSTCLEIRGQLPGISSPSHCGIMLCSQSFYLWTPIAAPRKASESEKFRSERYPERRCWELYDYIGNNLPTECFMRLETFHRNEVIALQNS